MKTQQTNLLQAISETELRDLTTEVREVLYVNYNRSGKTFSAAELWFIQRQHKSINQRRRAY